jgi:hypothetical protein
MTRVQLPLVNYLQLGSSNRLMSSLTWLEEAVVPVGQRTIVPYLDNRLLQPPPYLVRKAINNAHYSNWI